MNELPEYFKINTQKGKARQENIFKGDKYRITVLSDVLIRLEYNEEGVFNDYPTLFAINRSFKIAPSFIVKEDNKYLNISNDYFVLEYVKGKPFESSKLTPDSNLRVSLKDTDKTWYFNNPEVRNFKGAPESYDESRNVNLAKGLYNTDGFASFDDSLRPVFISNGEIKKNPSNGIDVYLFVYKNDFQRALNSYFELTGYPALLPRFAFGLCWNKNENYTDKDLEEIIRNFRKEEMPITSILLGNKYRKVDEKNRILSSYRLSEDKFPNITETINYFHSKGIYLGMEIKPSLGILPEDIRYNDFKTMLNLTKDGQIPLNIYSTKQLLLFLETLNTLNEQGIDYFWLNDKFSDKTLEFMYMHYIFTNSMKNETRRGYILSRNPQIASHRYPVSYSGETLVSWDTLKYLPFFNITSANIGLSYWSHDIGGYKDGTEDQELFTRYVQFGTYSPLFRFASKEGKFYKREPWLWDIKTNRITRDYVRVRNRLIPYIYSEAYKYTNQGVPLVRPVYHEYKEIYDEPLYITEYHFGSELFVCPITEPKDNVMNRVVKRIFLPEGTWYDFKTGNKFPGGKRYTTFYKDEDYPVYAKSGAIIPLAVLDDTDLNSTKPPKKLEVQVFPGQSNSFNLYEDDGVTNLYKEGYYIVTNIDYNYMPNNYTLIIRPVEGKTNIIPEYRDYRIKFRNTRLAESVKVNVGSAEVNYSVYTEGNDFYIEIENVPTSQQLTVNCGGKAIEIDAVRLINEDIEGILNDISLPTSLKEKVSACLFSDKPLRRKRIEIRKLRTSGLKRIFIRMFLKLLEYIGEI